MFQPRYLCGLPRSLTLYISSSMFLKSSIRSLVWGGEKEVVGGDGCDDPASSEKSSAGTDD